MLLRSLQISSILCNKRRSSLRFGRWSSKHSGGFTLIELLVSITIMSLLSGIIIIQYSQFDSTLLLRNLAYEVALSVREAQVLGISVRGAQGTAADKFERRYGVHFDKSASTNKTYILFRDANGNGEYTAGEALTTYTIARGSYISEICAGSTCTADTLDIMFKRPDPDALFLAKAGASTLSGYSDVQIKVTSPRDTSRTRTIRVTSTGQISVP